MTGTVTSSPPSAYEIPRSPRIQREEPDREELHPHAEAGDEEPGQDDPLTLLSSDPINASSSLTMRSPIPRCGARSSASERPYHAPRANDPSGDDERRRAICRPIGASRQLPPPRGGSGRVRGRPARRARRRGRDRPEHACARTPRRDRWFRRVHSGSDARDRVRPRCPQRTFPASDLVPPAEELVRRTGATARPRRSACSRTMSSATSVSRWPRSSRTTGTWLRTWRGR